MLTVVYDPINGTAVTDGNAEAFAANVLKSGLEQVTVGNTIMIDMFRVLVVRGTIKHTDLKFKYGDVVLSVHENGRLPVWPQGFCDTPEGLLLELLDAVD
ncbi:hypothetical protein pf16_153 [Pseudomonas phage pf16]|uniref:Uncharacterized protein n=1 Tax=Pseudomonas phage pf16 TaxID=1815630 RepID=A0A1S5R416_9CAUD|nr:hypothetical protein FDG98_gp145 [Pseudomonas phage pf16]AND75076.1 hypothetical protein pf16_153 [Pseudomonas phage pf16]